MLLSLPLLLLVVLLLLSSVISVQEWIRAGLRNMPNRVGSCSKVDRTIYFTESINTPVSVLDTVRYIMNVAGTVSL